MNSTTQTVIIVLFIVIALGIRIARQTREQRWSLKSMWIAPIIFLVITVLYTAFDSSITPWAPLAGIIGLAAGFALGNYQGNHTTLRFDKAGQAVYIRITPIGIALFLGVLLLRFGRSIIALGGTSMQSLQAGNVPKVSPIEALVGTGLLALAAGTILGLRWYVKRAFDAAP
jgi:hypothetical protein